MTYRLLNIVTLIVSGLFILSSCGVTENNMVRKGDSPEFRDEDVAFRTVYYFRVFDYCYNKNKLSQNPAEIYHGAIPETEGLYRFTMTGKANQKFNTVKFESGILKSSQIDPFGATVVYDEDTKSHRFISTNEKENSKRLAETERAIEKLQRLKTQYQETDSNGDGTPDNPDQITKLGESINTLIDAYTNQVMNQSGTHPSESQKVEITLPDGNKATGVLNNYSSQAIPCPAEMTVRKGFQILGPEGWRTFDPDERLILAMTTSAKPLVSTMKQMSDRVLNHKASEDQTMLLLAQEQNRISGARFKLLTVHLPEEKDINQNTFRDRAREICEELTSSTDNNNVCTPE